MKFICPETQNRLVSECGKTVVARSAGDSSPGGCGLDALVPVFCGSCERTEPASQSIPPPTTYMANTNLMIQLITLMPVWQTRERA
jgi:hypothetical protein